MLHVLGGICVVLGALFLKISYPVSYLPPADPVSKLWRSAFGFNMNPRRMLCPWTDWRHDTNTSFKTLMLPQPCSKNTDCLIGICHRLQNDLSSSLLLRIYLLFKVSEWLRHVCVHACLYVCVSMGVCIGACMRLCMCMNACVQEYAYACLCFTKD